MVLDISVYASSSFLLVSKTRMKLKIKVNDVEREIEIKGLKGRHKRQFMKKISDIAKKSKENQIEAIGQMEEFLDFQDKLALEVISLNEEEYNDLELEEQNKILGAIREILIPGSSGENLFF